MVRSRKRFKIKDFLLEWGKEASTASADGKMQPDSNWRQMKMAARMWAAVANADEAAKANKTAGRKKPTAQQQRLDKVAAAREALKAADRRKKR
jgi:hypothetical protein